MNPEKFGKTLGIGLRVAGRMAQQRVEGSSGSISQASNEAAASNGTMNQSPEIPMDSAAGSTFRSPAYSSQVRQAIPKAHNLTRAAGRGMGGFLRPFGRLGGILWLEVTGFFFGLFAIYFAQDIWKTRLSYAAGPQHQRFLIAIGLTVVFGYLSVSAFWRARRK